MSAFHTWYYHPLGLDVNGDEGPTPLDPGWVAVSGKTAEEALKQLPLKDQKKVMKGWKADDPKASLEDAAAESCTWGWPCSWVNEESWVTELENLGL